jgi:hypothetical protein
VHTLGYLYGNSLLSGLKPEAEDRVAASGEAFVLPRKMVDAPCGSTWAVEEREKSGESKRGERKEV